MHWRTADRRILLMPVVAVFLWIIGAAALALLWKSDPRAARAVLVGVGTYFVAGKPAAMAAGLAAGGTAGRVGAAVMLVDIAGIFLLYPLIEYDFLRRALNRFWIGRGTPRQKHKAESERGFIRRHGTWGLFVFMLLPFQFNSPPVAAFIGKSIGMPTPRLLATVFLGAVTTGLLWIALAVAGFSVAAKFDPRLPQYLSIGLVVLIAAGLGVHLLAGRRKARLAAQPVAQEK